MAAAETQYAMQLSAITAALVLLAFWPVWHWYALRILDRSDEPWGLVALATAAAFVLSEFRSAKRNLRVTKDATSIGKIVGMLSLITYIGTFSIAPNLVQAILLVLSMWFLLLSQVPVPSKAGVLGLLVLALPLIPSLNCFAGYPIRLLVATGACALLRCLGFHILQDGTMLDMNSHTFAIDAPCGGINMLWAEAYAAMLVACFFRLDLKRTGILSIAAMLLIVAGNTLRAASLVLFDLLLTRSDFAALKGFEPVIHPGIGLMTFCLITLATFYLSAKFAAHAEKEQAQSSDEPPQAHDISQDHRPFIAAGRLWLVPLCLVAIVVPFFAHPTASRTVGVMPPAWPTMINGMKVLPVDSLVEETAFAADFPGHMKRFTDGRNSYFVRVVTRETRQLHPSSDCFRGLGYSIEPQPLVVTAAGEQWSSFEASKQGRKYLVLERIHDEAGNSWTDVSQWYWSACFNKTKGPWWAVTIAQPL